MGLLSMHAKGIVLNDMVMARWPRSIRCAVWLSYCIAAPADIHFYARRNARQALYLKAPAASGDSCLVQNAAWKDSVPAGATLQYLAAAAAADDGIAADAADAVSVAWTATAAASLSVLHAALPAGPLSIVHCWSPTLLMFQALKAIVPAEPQLVSDNATAWRRPGALVPAVGKQWQKAAACPSKILHAPDTTCNRTGRLLSLLSYQLGPDLHLEKVNLVRMLTTPNGMSASKPVKGLAFTSQLTRQPTSLCLRQTSYS